MTLSVRRVASVVATVFGVLLVGVFVVQAAPGVIGADASYVVLSGSMEPAISPGDAVVVDDVDPTTIEVGSVITFVRSEGDTPVTHRVTEVLDREGGLAFRTAGDANEAPDPEPVPAENVTGEVWFVIPYVGHVVMFANTPTGFAVLVGLPLAAFVISELHAVFAGDGTTAQSSDESEHEFTFGEHETTDAPARPSPSSPSTDAITITTRDLQLSSVGFGALAVYSGYVASLDPTPVRVAVFAAAAMVVAFVAWLFVSASESTLSGQSGDNEPEADTLADGGETGGDSDDE